MTKLLTALAVVLVLASSCGDDATTVAADPTSTTSSPPTTTTTEPARSFDITVGVWEVEPGEVLLYVSNQSFLDDPIGIVVNIDGEPAIDSSFPVEDQHNWIGHAIAGLEPGVHTVTAVSDTGVEFEETFELPEGGAWYLVLDYWHYDDDPLGRHFSLYQSAEPVGFA